MSTSEGPISLRPAATGDEEMVFRWRNDPFIVARASLQREISWEEHQRWFIQTVAGNNRRMFIVEHDGTPVGQVRFDRESERDCVISAYLLPAFMGQGWGLQAIRTGCELIFMEWKVERVIACVRFDNLGGFSAFRKAGFIEIKSAGCPSEHHALVLSRAQNQEAIS